MTSKTTLFNKTLYKNSLCRFWPLWAGFALVLFLSVPTALFSAASDTEALRSCAIDGGILSMWPLVAFDIFLMAAASAMAVFGHLYIPKQTELFASLPFRRETVFGSAFAAALTAMAAAEALVVVLTAAIEAALGVLCLKYLLALLAFMLLASIALFGFAVFCAMLTGNMIAMPAVYAVLNITAPAVNFLWAYLTNYFVYGHQYEGYYPLKWLSPFWALASTSITREVWNCTDAAAGTGFTTYALVPKSFGIAAIYAAVGLLFAIAALALYRHRRMETTGDTVAIRALRPIFSVCMTFGCALIAAAGYTIIVTSGYYSVFYLGGSRFVWLFFWAAVGSFIGYFAAAMMMKKSFRVFRRGLPRWGILCAVILLTVLGIRLDIGGYVTRIPDADTVQRAELQIDSLDIPFTDRDDIEAVLELHCNCIENRSDYIRQAAENDGDNVRRVQLVYTLSNGQTLQRTYCVPCDSSAGDETAALLCTDEAVSALLLCDIPIESAADPTGDVMYYAGSDYKDLELTREQVLGLYAAIRQDREAGLLDDAPLQDFYTDSGRLDTDSLLAASIYICVWYQNDSGVSDAWSLDLTVPADAQATLAYLSDELGINTSDLLTLSQADGFETGIG